MTKVNLTYRFIKEIKPAASGQRAEYSDAQVPGLSLRVTDRGHKSFVLVARYPLHPKNPTRRALATYPGGNAGQQDGQRALEEAREKARRWLNLIGRGIDPKVEELRQKAAQQRQQANSFEAVAEVFLERYAPTIRHETDCKKCINGFVKRWGARPIIDIEPREVSAAVGAIAKNAPYQAHNAFGYLRRMFTWAIGTGEYGIERSPLERLKPVEIIGKREVRVRTLTDPELRAVWQAAGKMGYPYGPLFKLLILTGQREREVADISWGEIDLRAKVWTIPAARMKGGAAHEVPVGPDAIALLKSLPRWKHGEFVFTTTDGEKPVNGFSKAKGRIDKLCGVADWKIHDLRRSVRTELSALPVEDLVRELVIAHAKPGLHKVYDQHSYLEEKRECLELWERRLAAILAPPPPDEDRPRNQGAEDNVVEMGRHRRG